MLVLSILIAAAPADDTLDPYKDRIDSAPRDVATFIERRALCYHFSGEGGDGNRERDQEILEAFAKLRCEEIEADERSLQRTYRKQTEVLDLLEKTRDHLP